MEVLADPHAVAPSRPPVPAYWAAGHILFCLALIALGVYVIVESIRFSLPFVERGDASLVDMPGLTPIVCSVLLIALCVPIIVKHAAAGGRLAYFVSADFAMSLKGGEAKIFAIVFGALLVYVALLFPHLPYALATMIFLVATMALLRLFSWRSLIVAAATSGALWLIFAVAFKINLPH